MSKMSRKFMALLLVAIMTMGLSMTAFAAENNSPNATPIDQKEQMQQWIKWEKEWNDNRFKTDAEKTKYFAEEVYDMVSVPAGIGTIAKITDPNMQIKVADQIKAVYSQYVGNVKLKDTYGGYSYIVQEWAFDVQGVKSGEVTLKVADGGGALRMSEFVGNLVVVSHYNETTGKWETMDKLAELDANGCITINFSSYSPIVLHLTNFKASDLAADAGISVYKTTMTPVATPLSAPKTADNIVGIYVAILGCAVVGLGITRKRMAR